MQVARPVLVPLLRGLEAVQASGPGGEGAVFSREKPFRVRVRLEVPGGRLQCRLFLYADPLDGGSLRKIGAICDEVGAAVQTLVVGVEPMALEAGFYGLQAAVTADGHEENVPCCSFVEAGVIQIC